MMTPKSTLLDVNESWDNTADALNERDAIPDDATVVSAGQEIL